MMKRINNYILINSSRFFIKHALGYVFIGFDTLLAGVIFSRGASRNFLSRFIDIPYGIEVILYFMVFVLLAIAIALIVNNENNKGQIQLSADKLNLTGKEISLEDTPIIIYLNSSKGKGVYKRTIKNGGGNNWIEFAKNDKLKRYEFLISSQKEEEELIELINEYRKKGFKIELKASPPSLWEKLSF